MVYKKSERSKRKRNIGFSVDAALEARIEAYAAENGFTKSVAMRHMIAVFLREYVNSSNVEREVAKS